jgi:beta,beta-carotene 9',10'-dioxygenase
MAATGLAAERSRREDSLAGGHRIGFATLDAEVAVDPLPMTGAIPPWLSGTLVRTGPARFEVGERSYNHWFDGLAMLHKFGFTAGKVAYANRFLRSRDHRDAMNGVMNRSFATDPCRTLFQRVAALFSSRYTDNCNVNVDKIAGEFVAFTETRIPIRFAPDTLATLGPYRYDLPGQVSIAHPHHDGARGRHYTYMLEMGRKSTYRMCSIDQRTGQQDVVAEIPVARPAYMHSFGMTERYLVVTEFPLVVNPLRFMLGNRPFIENYEWEPQRGVLFHVIEKDSGRVVRTAQGPPVFAFHHVNAFEDGDDLAVDIVTYGDPGVIDDLYLERVRSSAPIDAAGELTRFRVPPAGDVRAELLSDLSFELPRIHYARTAGTRHRYVHGVGTHVPGSFIDQLVKLDMEGGAAHTWHEPGCYPSEPVFVPSPDAEDEDAGVVLSAVLDSRRPGSFLLVLDAASFRELARAEVPHVIPFTIHGNFFAG